MAPLNKAIKVAHKSTLEDGTKVYECNADPEWAMAAVALGGYVLGLVIEAATQFQASTHHPDIIYLSSQFLRPSGPGHMEIRVSKVKTGSLFTNLAAEVLQKKSMRATIQPIYCNFDRISTSDVAGLSLPTSHMPIHPITLHPSQTKIQPPHFAQRFPDNFFWGRDLSLEEKNDRHFSEGRSVDGMTMGQWAHLRGMGGAAMSPAYIPFFFEMNRTAWELLGEKHIGEQKHWYPSLALTVEFKCRLPLSSEHAAHTLGLFGRKRHLKDGIWTDQAELWSAPSELGKPAEIDDKWREKAVCVAISNQLASMTLPETNYRYAGKQKSKL